MTLAEKIAEQLEENQSYKDLATATAEVLKAHYGEHNYIKFINALANELGLEPKTEALDKAIGYDPKKLADL